MAVKEAVDALLPWYSSMHRGAGFPSRVATAAYEGARDAVLDFVGAPSGDAVVFTRHTTEAINVLANALPEDTGVVVFAGEHHADLLPWLRRRATVLPVPASPDEALDLLGDALVAARGGIGLVAVTGASNVTGEIWPYAEIAEIAHRHGARLLLDAAQLAPHRPIDMAGTGVDYLALSDVRGDAWRRGARRGLRRSRGRDLRHVRAVQPAHRRGVVLRRNSPEVSGRA